VAVLELLGACTYKMTSMGLPHSLLVPLAAEPQALDASFIKCSDGNRPRIPYWHFSPVRRHHSSPGIHHQQPCRPFVRSVSLSCITADYISLGGSLFISIALLKITLTNSTSSGPSSVTFGALGHCVRNVATPNGCVLSPLLNLVFH
jgi:hypothetical protein